MHQQQNLHIIAVQWRQVGSRCDGKVRLLAFACGLYRAFYYSCDMHDDMIYKLMLAACLWLFWLFNTRSACRFSLCLGVLLYPAAP